MDSSNSIRDKSPTYRTESPTRAGWQSSLGDFVETSPESILDALLAFTPDANSAQTTAWEKSINIISTEGKSWIDSYPPSKHHGTVCEYELPREGGRRPDIIVLQDIAVLVIEFKNKDRVHLGDVDQAAGYARDLKNYHSECHEIPVVPILLYMGHHPTLKTDGVYVTTPAHFSELILSLTKEYGSGTEKPNLAKWLAGRYEPLPGIVQAARLLFERQPLPFIRRAQSAGIPQTVELILDICEQARVNHQHNLVLLTGVPGAGKTLVGLQVVHSHRLASWLPDDRQHLNPASFLSGNGPLVSVLQNALNDKTFVQNMHSFIKEYAINTTTAVPHERVIVFDEAQRAWTAGKIVDFYGKKGIEVEQSEPELLVRLAQRMDEGCVILALIGSGQEIHTGEESGIQGWIDAIESSGSPEKWIVHAPPKIISDYSFGVLRAKEGSKLDLNVTLRSHSAEKLHEWVNGLLSPEGVSENNLKEIAGELRASAYPIHITRDLNLAKQYVLSRFQGECSRRYGLLASSKAKNLIEHGVDNSYQRFFNAANWFNADPEHKDSCCQLVTPAQEFHCQGLELDLPVVCWGDDVWWENEWIVRKVRRNKLVKNPEAFRINTYRVLLTRGREGLIIFIPPDCEKMNAVAERLEKCGAETMETKQVMMTNVA